MSIGDEITWIFRQKPGRYLIEYILLGYAIDIGAWKMLLLENIPRF
jgi:hypothetical protein